MTSPTPTASTTKPVTVTYTINVPAEFDGTDEQRDANYASHAWTAYNYGDDDFETVCSRCDAKPFHKHAEYPCGTEAPRVDVIVTRTVPIR